MAPAEPPLFTGLSPKSYPTLCKPNSCHHIKRQQSPAAVEKALNLLFSSYYSAYIFNVFVLAVPQEFESHLTALARNCTEKGLEEFRREFKKLVLAHIAHHSTRVGFDQLFIEVLQGFHEYIVGYAELLHKTSSFCLCMIAGDRFLSVLAMISTQHYVNGSIGESIPVHWLKLGSTSPTGKAWNDAEKEKFRLDLLVESHDVCKKMVEKSSLKDFEDYSKAVGATKLLLIADTLVAWQKGKAKVPGFQPPISFYVTFLIFRADCFGGGVVVNRDMLESLESTAHSFARNNLEEAATVDFFNAVAQFSYVFDDKELFIQAHCNLAAIRLLLMEEQPFQADFCIQDCTSALELDPNYVKALFRRGLALAFLKFWKLAIIDFEKALKLDPYSPAKAELIECRKHV